MLPELLLLQGNVATWGKMLLLCVTWSVSLQYHGPNKAYYIQMTEWNYQRVWAKIKLPAFSGDANAERPKTDFMTTEKLPNILKSNTENHQDVTVSIYNLSLRGDTHLHKKENGTSCILYGYTTIYI